MFDYMIKVVLILFEILQHKQMAFSEPKHAGRVRGKSKMKYFICL